MKYGIVCFFFTLTALTTAGLAQTSHVRSSDDPSAATRPLTPKSAMPEHRRSSITVPKAAGQGTNAELNHLEQQNVKSVNQHGSGSGKPNSGVPKSGTTSVRRGSDVNFTYQKPKTAKTPSASGASKSSSVSGGRGN